MFAAFSRNRRAIFAAGPIIGCNITAVIGQYSFLRDHVHTWPTIGIVMLAGTMESIALFLASEAAEAEKKGDASGFLRVASYAYGLFVGAINYSHYALPGFRPTVLAVVLGSMSAISPWLWAIYGRRIGRELLISLGIIEKRSVKFARVRWLMWPIETFGAFRLSAWSGTREPATAIREYELKRAERASATQAIADAAEALELAQETERKAIAERMTLANARTDADRVRVAIAESGKTVASEIAAWLAAEGCPGVTPAYIRQVRASDKRKSASARRNSIHALPSAVSGSNDQR